MTPAAQFEGAPPNVLPWIYITMIAWAPTLIALAVYVSMWLGEHHVEREYRRWQHRLTDHEKAVIHEMTHRRTHGPSTP